VKHSVAATTTTTFTELAIVTTEKPDRKSKSITTLKVQ
jgi:hypothetical protein